MAALLGKELFQTSCQGPPPSKDFFQLTVTKDQVKFVTWVISLQRGCRGIAPRQMVSSHADFLNDKTLRYEIGYVFGEKILNYVNLLCEGKFDYLERLSDELLLKIFSYLDVKDTGRVSMVSTKFQKICNSNPYWEQITRRSPDFTREMESIGNAMGWKRTYFTYFFETENGII